MNKYFYKIISILRDKPAIYPILIGALFLLNELRKNVFFYSFEENLSLIVIVLSFTLFVDFLSTRIIAKKSKAALIAALFIFINLFYQDISYTLSIDKLSINFIKHMTYSHPGIITFIIVSILFLSFLAFILKSRKSFKGLNLFLNLLVAGFILLEIIKWIVAPVPQIKPSENESLSLNARIVNKQKPDIYYIILDSYTSSESLKKYWHFDNSKFEDSLKRLGFFLPQKSKAMYINTYYCMASYLNSSSLLMNPAKQYNERNFSKYVRNNRLYDWLRANDYLCYNYSTFDAFGKKKYYNIFAYNHFLGRTIWCQIYLKLFYHPSDIKRINSDIINKVKEIPSISSIKPIFVYAHLIMPHEPYFFNETGMPFNEPNSLTNKQKYLSQLIFTNSLALDIIDDILSSHRSKPIIIIQGDHGFRNLLDTTQIERLFESHTIFYAIYSRYGISKTDTLSPINTFKEIIKSVR